MRKCLLVLVAILCGMTVRAQQTLQSGPIADFKTIDLSGKISATLIHAEEPGFEISLESSDRNRIQWGVSDGVLSVKLRPDANNTNAGVATMVIYYTDLSSIKLNGAEARADSLLQVSMLDVTMSAGAKATLSLDCRDLNMNVNGNSIAELTGSSQYFTLRAVTRSRVDARQLEAQSIVAVVQTASEAYLYTTERLVAETNAGSGIFYRGEPELLRVSTKLGGSVNNIGK